MKTLNFASSLALSPELLHSPKRLRLPVNHQTRLADGSLEFTAEVPDDPAATEDDRADFHYAVLENGREPVPIAGHTMEVSPFVHSKWLHDLDPKNREATDEIAFVKYTPVPTGAAES